MIACSKKKPNNQKTNTRARTIVVAGLKMTVPVALLLNSLLSCVGCDFSGRSVQPSAKQRTPSSESNPATSMPPIKSHYVTQYALKKLQDAVDRLEDSEDDSPKAEWVIAAKNSEPSTMTVDCGEAADAQAAFDLVWSAWLQPTGTLTAGVDAAEFKQKILDAIAQEIESDSDEKDETATNVTGANGEGNPRKLTGDSEFTVEYRGFRFFIDCRFAADAKNESSQNGLVVQLKFVDAKKDEAAKAAAKLKEAEDSN